MLQLVAVAWEPQAKTVSDKLKHIAHHVASSESSWIVILRAINVPIGSDQSLSQVQLTRTNYHATYS